MSKDEFMDEVSQRVTCVLIFATYSNLIDLISGSFFAFSVHPKLCVGSVSARIICYLDNFQISQSRNTPASQQTGRPSG